jgi:DNA polymerase-1
MITLLIDGDILVFQIASDCQSGAVDWGEGVYSPPVADLKEAQGRFRDRVASLKLASGADDVRIALKGQGNFRREVLPTYKANRTNLVPPMLRQPLMDWLLKHPQVVSRPGLEGDDVLGILATCRKDGGPNPDVLIWSVDKDLRQIPGNHWTQAGVEYVTPEQGDYQHMLQTLTGDATDNYGGCPGVGPVKAQRLLSDPKYRHPWDAVLAAYSAKGLSAEAALAQARVARILRANDYNYTERKPILWVPRYPQS